MIIAIDGPAGVGKSSVAEYIAQELHFFRLNSGDFYRAITLKVQEKKLSLDNEKKIIELAEKLSLELIDFRLFVDGVDVQDFLHNDVIDAMVAGLSAILPVRHIVNKNIERISKAMNIVAEGRDMTTVVFPDADVKIFMDASVESRAKRRYLQGTSNLSLEEITKSIKERDQIDRNKKEGMLKKSSGAFYLDTSNLTKEKVCAKVLKISNEYLGSREIEAVMTEKDLTSTEKEQQSDLQEFLDSFENLEEGQLIEGEVIEVTSENVFIDVGYKSEGKISISEFDTIPAVGDKISVVLIKKEGKNGEVQVSKKKAEQRLLWKNLKQAFQDREPIDGTFVKSIKGGFEVDLGIDQAAFCPISKADISKIENPEEYIGIKSKFFIERVFNEKRINIVVSRKDWLEKDILKRRTEFFEKTVIGDTVEGVVKSFTSFGAFIDLGGFDGLLHINDMSWGHVTRPKDHVKKGQKVELKVIRLDPEEQRINLSLKHFTDDPWSTFESKYSENTVIKGKVTKMTDFGAFIEIEEGIEGLAHISELSWVKRINHPKEVLSIGDEVEAMILAYDIQNGRVSLGVKQVLPNPWDDIASRYPVGTKLTRTIKKVTNSGAFIELEEGIDGFLHIDDLSWIKKYKYASAALKENEEIEFIVLDIDTESMRIRLGVKQLTEDPWASLRKTYPRGSEIEGVITNKTDFGLFVKVPGDIEGLVHKGNISASREVNPDDAMNDYNVGDTVKTLVLDVNPERQKLSLSIKELKIKQERKEISKYIQDEKADKSTFTLGDFLQKKDDE